MHRSVMLQNGVVCVMKKYRRARCLRIIVHADGGVSLTLPFFVSYAEGVAFLESKSDWIQEKRLVCIGRPEHLFSRGSEAEYRQYAAEALTLLYDRLEYFGRAYGVTWARVTIRNQKTRWGSCSRQGNLSFNYRLLFLPPRLRDYVVVHELCHLKEFNHSPKFWTLVAQTFPDYRSLRQELHLT